MARKKKTLSQSVVNVATTGMPQPVRKFLGGRIAALLIVVGAVVLVATGTLQIKWENGRPSVSFNKQRAEELKAQATTKIRQLEECRAGQAPTVKIPGLGGGDTKESVGQRIDDLKKKVDNKLEESWQNLR